MGLKKLSGVVAVALAALVFSAAPAAAYEWPEALKKGDSGPDVRALQMRVAGWFPRWDQTFFPIKGDYQGMTVNAVKRFQEHYGLTPDGIAGPSTFEMLDSLEDGDRSTKNFAFSEFHQNSNSNCSKEANSYAGTFKGGMTTRARVKRNVIRLMWRLEALRAKLGDNPIAINSGFRSVAYNRCINGATYSQHQYGTAADLRVVDVSNRLGRNQARRAQVHGIGCYSTLSHNHLDLRMQNRSLPQAKFWWWPDRDVYNRDLSADGRPCYGEEKQSGSGYSASHDGGADGHEHDLHEWTEPELDQWKAEGEASNLHGLD